jgi:hypothetical protein
MFAMMRGSLCGRKRASKANLFDVAIIEIFSENANLYNTACEITKTGRNQNKFIIL